MQEKIERLGFFGVLLVLAVMFGMGAHYACGDQLIFHSDLWSLTVYFGVIAVLAAPLLLFGILLTRFLPANWRAGLSRMTMVMFAMLVASVFLRFALSFVVDCGIFSWQTAACTAVGALAVIYGVNRKELIQRVQFLGFAAFIAVCLVPLMVAWNHASPHLRSEPDDKKHLVLIVLDGFPTQFLASYNPQVVPSRFDELLESNHQLREFRTSSPYTNQFFATLYTGDLNPQAAKRPELIDGGNLLASLQQNDVNAKCMVFHRNGSPEGSSAHLSSYAGLRSYLLVGSCTWVPQLLGLDYHVWLGSNPNRTGNMRFRLGSYVRHLLRGNSWAYAGDGPPPWQNIFIDRLLPEMRAVQGLPGSSFTVFHIHWKWAGFDKSLDESGSIVKLESAQSKRGGGIEAFSMMRKDDNRYGPEMEPLAKEVRDEVARLVAVSGDKFADFLAAVRSDEQLQDTTFIVTGDHGSIHGKGRFWKGYHPNQEVVKVLGGVFSSPPNPRKDERLFSTPDLTVSILDYFEITSPLQEESESLFGDGPGQTHTITLTLPTKSGNRHEWWLVVVRGEIVYWFNLAAEGSGELKAFKRSTHNEVEIELEASPRAIPDDLITLVRDSLKRFGVSQDTIHESFRQALAD